VRAAVLDAAGAERSFGAAPLTFRDDPDAWWALG